MKKLTIAIGTVIISAGITAGVLVNQPKEAVVPEQEVEQVIFRDGEKNIIKVIESTPKEQAVPEPTTTQAQEPEQPSEPTNVFLSQSYEKQYGEMFLLVRDVPVKNGALKGQVTSMTSAALKYTTTNPELFTPETIQDTAKRCVAYFDSLSDTLYRELGNRTCKL